MSAHKWTTDDEILALALYFRRKSYPPNDFVMRELEASLEKRGISSGSLNVKMALIQCLELGTKPTFGRIGQRTRSVWDAYHKEPFILQREAKIIMKHEQPPEQRDDSLAQ